MRRSPDQAKTTQDQRLRWTENLTYGPQYLSGSVRVLAAEEEEDQLSEVVARDKQESRPIGSQRCLAENAFERGGATEVSEKANVATTD
ncbi:hypothetical protein LA080_012148 [Diaporthe eres]|nr:hypothetical protein LA080_012148 [Diaporthe eres]